MFLLLSYHKEMEITIYFPGDFMLPHFKPLAAIVIIG